MLYYVSLELDGHEFLLGAETQKIVKHVVKRMGNLRIVDSDIQILPVASVKKEKSS